MSLTVEESNFLRFYFLNLKIASKAIRVYFDSVHPPAGLATELANSKANLTGLKFMTQLQLQILYPSTASNVISDNFDTTLIVCLIRNMIPRESAPVTGWDNLPHPGDSSKGADIARVKWYRNKLVHSKDGILAPSDVIQYWGDLEGAIGRLGGSNLLIEAQSTKHIVLDKSLTDMLTKIRINEHYIEENKIMMDKLQVAFNTLKTNKEHQEDRIQQLNDSLQKGGVQTQKHAAELSAHKESIHKYSDEIAECKKEIEKIYSTIKGKHNEVTDKQNQVFNLTHLLVRLECRYNKTLNEIDGHLIKHGAQMEKHDEQLAKHDEQIATSAKDIEDMKKKQHDTSNIPEDTKALIGADLREDTFVVTGVVSDGLLLLKKNGVLLITGHAGTGKSRTGRHVLHIFCTDDTLYKCIKLNTLNEWEDMVSREDKIVVLLDDIFGETNCIYNRENDTPILDKIHAYICKGNIKVIITIRNTVKRQCQELFDDHRLFKFDIIDLSSDKYKLNSNEKETILTKYMKTVRKSEYIKSKGFVGCNGDLILKSAEVRIIIHENPVKGFPLVIYQFVHNDKYFYLGSKFFDSPTESILEEVRTIRCKGEDHKKFMIQYAVMVYTAINENCINPDDTSCVLEITQIIDAIYGETIKLKKFHIADAVMDLKGSYLINIPNQRSYELHHPTVQESIIISFAQVDEENMNKIIPLISWSFFLKIVKPESYTEKDGEVVLRIPTNSYKLLADRLAEFYMAESTYSFVSDLSNTEIFQQKYRLLLPCLLEALEKEDTKDIHTENMIRCGETYRLDSYFENTKRKECFLAHLLNIVAKSGTLDKYDFILKTFNQMIKSSNNHNTKVNMKFAIITSLYTICSIKDEHDVKSVKATLDIVEENKIPVLLDQGIILTSIPTITSMSYIKDASKTCVFLTLCIWKAYEIFNIPVLEFLISKYNKAPFYSNLFLKMVYGDTWINEEVKYQRLFREMPSLSCDPLKWMMERFDDQDFNDVDFILDVACKYLMFDTVEYLVSRFKTTDAFSCVLSFWQNNMNNLDCSHLCRELYNQELLNFLFTTVDFTSTELIPVVTLFLQNFRVPDHMYDAFVPVCVNNTNILNLACRNGQFYFVHQLIENCNFQCQVDIQSFIISACMTKDRQWVGNLLWHDYRSIIELEKLRIVKYIVGKFGFDQLDLKAACQQACDSELFKIVEWFVQNIETTMLDVYSIMDAALKHAKPDILECILNKIEISSLDKRKALKSVTKHYNGKCSTVILKVVTTMTNNTTKKEELEMQQIVNIAYERKCFGLLMCICNACNLYSSLDGNTLLMLACGNGKGRPPTFDFDYYDNDDEDYGDDYFDELSSKLYPEYGNIGMVTWIFKHFKIDNLDIKSGVLRLISQGWYHWQHMHRRVSLCNLVVSLLEKYSNVISTEEIKVLMNKALEHNYYVLVNWILENKSNCLFDKQKILNKACAHVEIKTVKLLSKYFFALDMNQAMVNACAFSNGYYVNHHEFKGFKDVETWLSLLWDEIDHDSIDIGRLVSTVCKEKTFNTNVMTWILLNLPQEQIPINEVLKLCCQQRRIYHVEYIFHKFDNKQLDIRQAFFHACREVSSTSSMSETFEYNNIILVDFLFQKLLDHEDNAIHLSFVLNEIPETNKHFLILYFLDEGFCNNINFKHLMNEACYHGHVNLVQWILVNKECRELNILDAMFNAFDGIKHAGRTKKSNPFKTKCVVCLALIWHYTQDTDILEILTVEEIRSAFMSISDTDSFEDYDADFFEDSYLDSFDDYLESDNILDPLSIWLQYMKTINQRKIYQLDSVM
ncbi:Hypothetical predicted protein [Mytilus galloprovincialis]|uniref:DZIP3-like HEPN domain-containing protein n=1 Tax=Mytilus galloprovincialis TaxID=29158 RepID=A0A8B6GU28_MYTGA|nr:Hypothetical predicted protein [Mytilus galloprovincialis]